MTAILQSGQSDDRCPTGKDDSKETLAESQNQLNSPVLVGKGRPNGGSIDVDFNDDALYAPYT
jgi:hypothetical protein